MGRVRYPLLLVVVTAVEMLQHLVAASSSEHTNTRLYAKAGDDVTFVWRLPDSLRGHTLVVSHDNHNMPSSGDDNHHLSTIFFASTADANSTFSVKDAPYDNRVDVEDHLVSQGLVQFTLRNVSSRDAGKYVCGKGMMMADIVQGCGQALVIVGTPENTSAAIMGTEVVGSDVTQRCSATSTSVPRDHGQPMRYRWFESDGDRREGVSDWIEILPDHEPLADNEHLAVNENVDEDSGSGEVKPEVSKGDNLGSLSKELRVASLERGHEGRRFTCSVSEGLGLWSPKSSAVVLRPQWKPLTSDLTLVPNVTSVTLTVGESTHVICAADCRPNCNVAWHKVLGGGDKTATVVQSSNLSLSHVSHISEGWYRCRADNTHGAAFVEWKLFVTDAPKPWFSDTTHVILVVVLATVILALGMTAAAVVVVKCRNRNSPIIWPHQRRPSDAVPLSSIENRSHNSNLVSYL